MMHFVLNQIRECACTLYLMKNMSFTTERIITMRKGMTKREREVTDPSQILEILDTCKILHLGLVDGDQPYIVPMNYGYTMEDGHLTLYLHAATKGYKLDLMRANPRVCFSMECDVQMFEGRVACQYGTVYKSLMGKGMAELIEDVEDKKKFLSIFMKTQTGKDFAFDDRMVSIVSIIKIDVSDYSAKARPLPAALRGEE